MPVASCEEGSKPIEYALESTENLEKGIEKKNYQSGESSMKPLTSKTVLIYHLTTWEKRSFQRVRHIETSEALTVASEDAANWKILLTNCHVLPSILQMCEHMEATKPNITRTRRTGAYRNSQRTQNKGYKIQVAAVYIRKSKSKQLVEYHMTIYVGKNKAKFNN